MPAQPSARLLLRAPLDASPVQKTKNVMTLESRGKFYWNVFSGIGIAMSKQLSSLTVWYDSSINLCRLLSGNDNGHIFTLYASVITCALQ